jgi:hypothetical protein
MKQTPLRTLKLRAFVSLCTLLSFPISCALRFIPKEQKRADLRGRTIATYEYFGDALNDLKNLHNGTLVSKEPEHGTYYLAVEIRSPTVEKLGKGRRNRDNITVPLPLSVSQGVSGQTVAESHAAHSAEAAHVDEAGAAEDRGVHQPDHRSYEDARSAQPVGKVKVDLSKIGVA